jgi:hypothetical protein
MAEIEPQTEWFLLVLPTYHIVPKPESYLREGQKPNELGGSLNAKAGWHQPSILGNLRTAEVLTSTFPRSRDGYRDSHIDMREVPFSSFDYSVEQEQRSNYASIRIPVGAGQRGVSRLPGGELHQRLVSERDRT